jgi:hypothetical protein
MKPVYTTVDNVKLFEGDSFYMLAKDLGRETYHIKYWNARVMETFKANSIYLEDKLKFSNKESLKDYIDSNNIIALNYNLIFK